MSQCVQTGAHKQCQGASNLNRNFDLSVIDHIGQLENPYYCYTRSSCTLTVHVASVVAVM